MVISSLVLLLFKANTEYEPSIREDISEMLPFATDQTEESISENLQCRFHRAVGLEIASKQGD